jgi:predicted amidohydrolase YtcJ
VNLGRAGAGWALLLALAGGCAIEYRQPVSPADLVLLGGQVYTMSPARTWAQAVVVRDGRIAFVGDDSLASRYIGRRTRVLDLGGSMVLPGFQDTHVHPLSGGLELGECNLNDAGTRAEVERAVAEYARTRPDLAWIKGNGWSLPVFPAANPRRELLDRLIPDRPAFFYSEDGHSAWVNSRALAMAGITRDTRDPPNGRIERDPTTGEPSGTLRESAMGLVSSLLPPYTPGQRIGAVRRALADANRFGITSLTDADADEDYLEAYAAVARGEGLTARVTAAIHAGDDSIAAEVARASRLRQRYSAPRLSVGTVKLYADGVIEARTAALLQPYLDRPGYRGELNYPEEDFKHRIAAYDRAGFQIHIHAIGDRAIRVSLDGLEKARAENGPRDARPVLAHIQLIDPADQPRFRRLGVAASFQPYWAQADGYITDLTLPALGPARSRWLYPINTMLNTGAVVVGGSDWTVSSLNPLDAIEVALTRRDTGLPPGPAWIPEERADLPRMLAAYTINAAWVTRSERETGSLEPGKVADLIVIDRNLFDLPPDRIHEARVLLTLVEGAGVWRDPGFRVP